MSSTTGAVILLVVLAAVLAIAFVAFWVRDKQRADEEKHDLGRIQQEPTHTDAEHRHPS
ncbi:MAG: hypothetical protein J7518_06320 [Nocardioidaceae bacterium]|nr:hypothetical protein [Nocardioidaceae bacterium]